ncbi:hypothetical protein SAMN05660330_04093 [Desulforhopalus singaporensis]|uniref:Gene product 88 domain-containing protein n=2 Tax=Desulforhopalus singaporensis TaxID=91360 RepID=A0A1H0VI82_9BACT|nr:hypothetical protein SAMN05660330_04093 [Desulforhopalus singaporensis]
MGRIPAVSLPPVTVCAPDVPCSEECYALKSYRMYPNVRQAWNHNFDLLISDRDKYFSDIEAYLNWKSPRYFRQHVSGDIRDQDYFKRMKSVARSFPGTSFLAFTKRYDLEFGNMPSNLNIVISMWTGETIPDTQDLPKAWMQDGSETKIPDVHFICTGLCDSCYKCWHLTEDGPKDVVLMKH